jgi:acyl carrier protein
VPDTEPLHKFIRREFLYDDNAALTDDQPLFPDVIDSLDIMTLVDFLEETYGIELDVDELTADNFGTVRAVTELVGRKAT